MAAIVRERQAAQRARRGLSASAPRARLNAIAKRLERMGLERGRSRGDRRRGRAHLSAGAASRASRLRQRRAGALHAFRARVVDLRYQLALVACAWPEALNAQAEGLDELRDVLGAFNDLHVLAKFAAEQRRAAS